MKTTMDMMIALLATSLMMSMVTATGGGGYANKCVLSSWGITFMNTYDLTDINVLSFGSFNGQGGDVQGRLMVRNSANLQSWTIGDVTSGTKPYSLIVGKDLYWKDGTLVSESGFVGGYILPGTSDYLLPKLQGKCDTPGCKNAAFDQLQSQLTIKISYILSNIGTLKNGQATVSYSTLELQGNSPSSLEYYIPVTPAQINAINSYSLININPNANLFLVFPDDTSTITFVGGGIFSNMIPTEKVAFLIPGVRNININTGFWGSIVAPKATLKLSNGIIYGTAFFGDISQFQTQANVINCGGSSGCTTATDCPGYDTECSYRTCKYGACGVENKALGTPITNQIDGDCKKKVCDGYGGVTSIPDPYDKPADDYNPCTIAKCNGTYPVQEPVADGTPCPGGFCTWGECKECYTDAQCGTNTECVSWKCEYYKCKAIYTTANTPVQYQTDKDCKKNVCDGYGHIISIADPYDKPADDYNPCTVAKCNGTYPVQEPVEDGTPCPDGFCKDGECKQCYTDSQCGTNTDCKKFKCEYNKCKTYFTPINTPTSTQTDKDCKKNVCDGYGGVTSIADPYDKPAEDYNPCTIAKCDGSNPVQAPVEDGTTCPGGFCKWGECKECYMDSQCGTNTECVSWKCEYYKCKATYTAANTPVQYQTDKDCKKNVCDGYGNIISIADPYDKPAEDYNPCTVAKCNGTYPVQEPVVDGTPCPGGFCTCGECKECYTDTQCGTDTECKTFKCEYNKCKTYYTAVNTPVTTQTAMDCKKNVCDGNGGTISIADPYDKPAEDYNPCTIAKCDGSNPVQAPVEDGTPCPGGFCKWGECKECYTDTQCGTSTDCKKFKCEYYQCKTYFTPINTPTSTQTDKDCKKNVCDGYGGVTSIADPSDKPADDYNPCTVAKCNGTYPVQDPVADGTPCPGGFCTCGECKECYMDSQCGSDTQCKKFKCENYQCKSIYTEAYTPVTYQTDKDCKKNVCDGNGGIISIADPYDKPANDYNPCTIAECDGSNPVQKPVDDGTPCPGGFCKWGECKECYTDSQCGTNTDCKTFKCEYNKCKTYFTPINTPTSTQTDKDCKKNVCDGYGGVTSIADPYDKPAEDYNPCTIAKCDGSNPVQAPVEDGTTCPGGFCKWGECKECYMDSQCGTNTECVSWKCEYYKCKATYTAANTPVTYQTDKDCKKNVCDGYGNIISIADPYDKPADDYNPCTVAKCNGTYPVQEPVADGTPCPGGFCTWGECKECYTDTQCGTDTECKTFKCEYNKCKTYYTTANTAVSTQTDKDCKKNVCDGYGNIISIADPYDKPADDYNPCTVAKCNGTYPVQDPVDDGTPCPDGFCKDGQCKQCYMDSQCGTSTDCKKFKCEYYQCKTYFTPINTPTSTQTDKDCKKNVCDGYGGVTSIADPSDKPADDYNPCTIAKCDGSNPVQAPVEDGTTCPNGYCKAGNCVECITNAQCGTNTFCVSWKCEYYKCKATNTQSGTPLPYQIEGDCKKQVCNGAGVAINVTLASDVPSSDGNPCTKAECNGMSPVQTPLTGTYCPGGMCYSGVCKPKGCTYTQGWYKNHDWNTVIKSCPLTYTNGGQCVKGDSNVPCLNQNTKCCGMTYKQWLLVSPSGNSWIQLFHQWITAVNNLNKDMPEPMDANECSVLKAVNQETTFNTCGAKTCQLLGLTSGKPSDDSWIPTLDDYNNSEECN